MARNLRNWLNAYMEFTADTESPQEYHFWTGVSVLAAATKRQLYLDMNYFKIHPNMYVILVGPSGARKSIATSIGMDIATRAGIRKFSDKITGAALIKTLSECGEKHVEMNNATATGFSITSSVMIYASELGVFMGTDAYSTGTIADLTDLYDCPEKWEKKTIARDAETVFGPFVSLLAATTPQTLKDVIPTGAVGQGFTSRILFVWAPRRRKRVPVPNWDSGYEMLRNNLVADLKSIMRLRGQFRFTTDGFKAYKQHYMEHPEPEDEYEDERLRGYASRKDVHTLKLAQVLSLAARDDLTISEVEITGAIDAFRWLDQGLSSVFAGHGAAANSEDIVRVFRQIETGTKRIGYISHAELLKRNYYHFSAPEFQIILTTLVEAGAIEEMVARDPRSNKVSRLYKVVDYEFIKQQVKVLPKAARND